MLAIPQTCSGTTLSTGTVSWCLLGMRTQQAPSHSRFHTEINPFSEPSTTGVASKSKRADPSATEAAREPGSDAHEGSEKAGLCHTESGLFLPK